MSFVQRFSIKSFRLLMALVLVTTQVSVYVGFTSIGQANAELYQPYCIADQQGDEDFAGQDDIQQGCFTYAPNVLGSSAFAVAWSWDETSFTSSSHACGLVDTDGDGSTDLAVCGLVNGAGLVDFTVYSCDDSAILSCGSAAEIILVSTGPPNFLNTCNAFIDGDDDPFNTFGEDTLARCIFAPADFGVTANSRFIDACSYSSLPTAEALDCIYRTPNMATITVTKELTPSYNPGTVSLTVEGSVEASSVGNGGTTGPVTIPVSEGISIGENATGGTDLLDYSTTFACHRGNTQIWSSSTQSGSTSRSRTIPQGLINEGEQIDCIIANTVKGNVVEVTKVIEDTNGGLASPSDFSFIIEGYSEDPIQFEADGTNELLIPNGDYSIVEVEENTNGYATTYDGCGLVSIDDNDPVATRCTVTNTALPATLTVNKVVINDNGGSSVASDFSFYVNEANETYFENTSAATGSVVLTVPEGSYTVDENVPEGYSVNYENCAGLQLSIGESATCTITNDDVGATLTVQKTLVQDHGATDNVTAFGFTINDGPAQYFDEDGSVSFPVNAGSYSVEELPAPGYDVYYDNCSDVAIGNGQQLTCYITNNDQPAYVTINKQIINNQGGDLTLDGVTLFLFDGENYTLVESGIQIMLAAGSYTAGEEPILGYLASDWTGDCASDGSLSVVNGISYECTIINDDQPGIINVHKTIINDNGGEAVYADFTFTTSRATQQNISFNANGHPTQLGVTAGSISIIENDAPGYDVSYDNCTDIQVENGGVYDCYITNDDIAPELYIQKNTNPCVTDQEFEFSLYDGEGPYANIELQSLCSGLNANIYEVDDTFVAGPASISEITPDGWYQSSAYCFNLTDQVNLGDPASFMTEIGKSYECQFFNSEYSTITVTKFHDYNENGEWDEGEPTLEGWDMNLTTDKNCKMDVKRAVVILAISDDYECPEAETLTETTNGSGEALFSDIKTGDYGVSEVLQEDWVQSSLNCENYSDEYRLASNLYDEVVFNEASVEVSGGETIDCYVGNHRKPKVSLEKTNNATGPVQRGTEITFTLTVAVPSANESGVLRGNHDGPEYLPVTVTDNLTDEFDYIAGSFTAISSVRGDLKDAGITTDPNYASPGVWTLTNLASNEVLQNEIITLTYRALVGSTVNAGSYPTTASVIGYGDVIAVTATANDDDQVVVIVPAVLGASTTSTPVATKAAATLASTGQNSLYNLFIAMVLMSLTIGLAPKRLVVAKSS